MTSDAIFKELICGHSDYALDSLMHCYCAIIILAFTSKRHDGYNHFQIVMVSSLRELGHGITVRPGIGEWGQGQKEGSQGCRIRIGVPCYATVFKNGQGKHENALGKNFFGKS